MLDGKRFALYIIIRWSIILIFIEPNIGFELLGSDPLIFQVSSEKATYWLAIFLGLRYALALPPPPPPRPSLSPLALPLSRSLSLSLSLSLSPSLSPPSLSLPPSFRPTPSFLISLSHSLTFFRLPFHLSTFLKLTIFPVQLSQKANSLEKAGYAAQQLTAHPLRGAWLDWNSISELNIFIATTPSQGNAQTSRPREVMHPLISSCNFVRVWKVRWSWTKQCLIMVTSQEPWLGNACFNRIVHWLFLASKPTKAIGEGVSLSACLKLVSEPSLPDGAHLSLNLRKRPERRPKKRKGRSTRFVNSHLLQSVMDVIRM